MVARKIVAVDETLDILTIPLSGDTYEMTRALLLTGETITGSGATNLLSLVQTWNTTGTPTAFKLNVTDTASNAASLLLDLQVGGVSKAWISKTGAVRARQFEVEGYGNVTSAGGLIWLYGTGVIASGGVRFGAVNASDIDTILLRDAAGILAQRNSTSAQTFRLYNTYTDASNYERLSMLFSSNTAEITNQYAGTGSARSLKVYSSGTNMYIGSGGDVQWNVDSNRSFSPTSTSIYDIGATGARIRTGYFGSSLIGSQDTSTLDIATTWNTTGTPTAFKLDVTDTASNASSLLMNLLVGGSSRFKVAKDGAVTMGSGNLTVGNDLILNGAAAAQINWGSTYPSINCGSSGGDAGLTLTPGSSGYRVRVVAGTNPLALELYNTYTDASNYERAAFKWVSNVLEIGPEKAGTGSNRGTLIRSPGANLKLQAGTGPWEVSLSTAGHLSPGANGLQDNGVLGGRWRSGNYGSTLTGSEDYSTLDISTTWNTTGTPTAFKLNVTDTASNASSLLADFSVGGSSKLKVKKNGVIMGLNALEFGVDPSQSSTFYIHATNGFVYRANTRLSIASACNLTWGGSSSADGDLILTRDAANTLALRNSTNMQTFRVYESYTDASNYRGLFIAGGFSTYSIIQATGAGTGSTGGGIAFYTGSSPRWQIESSANGGHFFAGSDNTYDIGAAAANRPRNLFLGSYQQMSEMTAPAAPSANGVRIYAVDNGAGKTQLMALFASGAAQQIAIEP